MEIKQGIYKLDVDFRRGGNLSGIFLSTNQDVEVLINNNIEIAFGEVNGKHSDINIVINESDIILVTDNEEAIECFSKYQLQNGYDPFTYEMSYYTREHWGLDEDAYYIVQDLVNLIIKYD